MLDEEEKVNIGNDEQNLASTEIDSDVNQNSNINKIDFLNSNFSTDDKIKILQEKIINLELEKLKEKENNESLQNSVSILKSDFRLKIDQLNRNFEDAKKEKENMVLKFAHAEQRNIEFQKKIKETEGKLREKIINIDQLIIDKDKLSKELRSRIQDYSSYEKELNNLKASLTIAEQKMKNEDIKYKEEVDKNREIRKKYEDLQKNILVMKEENSTLRLNCQEIVKTYQDSEDMRSNSLTTSIKQIKEEMKKCNDEKKEAIDNFNKINCELQSTKQSINNQIQEIKNLKDKLKHAEADRMCQDETIKQSKDAIKSLNFVKDQLNERISHLEPFESQITQLSQERSRLTAANEDLRKIADDSEVLVGTLRQKESELLEFIQSLSNKNAQLQTEKQELTKESEKFQQQICRLEQRHKEAYVKINFWEEKSKSESKIWMEERRSFNKEVDKLKNELTIANQKLVDFDDQIYSLNKRHKAHIKDLTRQLTKSGPTDPNRSHLSDTFKRDVKSDIARSYCSTSDESQNSTPRFNGTDHTFDQEVNKVCKEKIQIFHPAPFVKRNTNKSDLKNITTTFCHTPEIQMIEPHNQMLIEKIVKLQRLNAKLQDKIDFLNEHTSQLTLEIQKKTYLLKYLFCEIEEKGSIKSETIDENHFMMSKKGGIMASVYTSRSVDDSMTLELSLEISRRLQSVLEDTTIKNITLKESINTLGEEISKLYEENRSLKKSVESV